MISHQQLEVRTVKQRLIIALLIVGILMTLLVMRMAWLQITHYEKYQELADGNRIRVEPILPTRGRILDRNGLVLADNQTVYTLEVHRDALPRSQRSLESVTNLLNQIQPIVTGVDERAIRRLSQQWRRMNRHLPFTLARISEEDAAKFSVVSWQYPGLVVNAIPQRLYPKGQLASHVIGYIGRMSLEDLRTLDSENYRNTEFVGKNGIEQRYENDLHGITGLRYVEVDAKGRTIREIERIPPTTGKDIVLALDADLQQFSENLLGNRKGAIVALDPRNGEVLALASTPTFDPNAFVIGMDNDSYQQLIKDESKPLLNRAIQSRYPPGSTIKPLMALIGLESGVIRPETQKFAGPFFEYKGLHYRDWKKGGHGMVNMNKAIQQSCDVYFYELALDMTIKRMSEGLKEFGIGEKTGIDLEGESVGVRPSPEWKRKALGKPWYPGETIIAGIGQGYMLSTPLQLAQISAHIATRGNALAPRLVKPAESERDSTPKIVLKNPRNWDIIIDAMIDVVHGPTGTAKRALPLIHTQMAGKTGTAQVVGYAQDTTYDAENIPEHLRDHALFIGFAPARAPKIAIAVMIENGGSGGGTASPIGGLVVDFWQRKTGQYE